MKQATYLFWISFGFFLSSVATVLKFEDNPEKWKFYSALAGSVILFIICGLALIAMLRKKKMNKPD